jgi:hypothetical protein
MPIKRLSQSGLLTFAKHSSVLAGNAPFNPNSFDLLETTTLTTSASSVTFSGLGAYSDYKHLQIRMVGRGSATQNPIRGRFNSDSGTNYARHFLYGDGTSVQSVAHPSVDAMSFAFVEDSAGISGSFGAAVIDILDFSNASKNTTIRSINGVAGTETQIYLTSGAWFNTDSVTSIEMFFYADSMIAGSRFSLYGVK